MARLRTLYGRYNEPADQERIDALLQERETSNRLMSSRDYKALLSSFMELQMQRAGKIRWGNNVPKDLFHLDVVLSFFPDAKIVACVRDPRDFLLSYQHKWKATSAEHAHRVKSLYHPVLTALLWRASVKEIARLRPRLSEETLIVLKYEELVARPGDVVRRLCRFIGEEFEENMLNVTVQNSSFGAEHTGIFRSSVGRWRSRLSPGEVCIAETVTKRWLEELGYECSTSTPGHWKAVYMWATLPYAFARAAYYNRAFNGPLVPYVRARLRSLFS